MSERIQPKMHLYNYVCKRKQTTNAFYICTLCKYTPVIEIQYDALQHQTPHIQVCTLSINIYWQAQGLYTDPQAIYINRHTRKKAPTYADISKHISTYYIVCA